MVIILVLQRASAARAEARVEFDVFLAPKARDGSSKETNEGSSNAFRQALLRGGKVGRREDPWERAKLRRPRSLWVVMVGQGRSTATRERSKSALNKWKKPASGKCVKLVGDDALFERSILKWPALSLMVPL